MTAETVCQDEHDCFVFQMMFGLVCRYRLLKDWLVVVNCNWFVLICVCVQVNRALSAGLVLIVNNNKSLPLTAAAQLVIISSLDGWVSAMDYSCKSFPWSPGLPTTPATWRWLSALEMSVSLCHVEEAICLSGISGMTLFSSTEKLLNWWVVQ